MYFGHSIRWVVQRPEPHFGTSSSKRKGRPNKRVLEIVSTPHYRQERSHHPNYDRESESLPVFPPPNYIPCPLRSPALQLPLPAPPHPPQSTSPSLSVCIRSSHSIIQLTFVLSLLLHPCYPCLYLHLSLFRLPFALLVARPSQTLPRVRRLRYHL